MAMLGLMLIFIKSYCQETFTLLQNQMIVKQSWKENLIQIDLNNIYQGPLQNITSSDFIVVPPIQQVVDIQENSQQWIKSVINNKLIMRNSNNQLLYGKINEQNNTYQIIAQLDLNNSRSLYYEKIVIDEAEYLLIVSYSLDSFDYNANKMQDQILIKIFELDSLEKIVVKAEFQQNVEQSISQINSVQNKLLIRFHDKSLLCIFYQQKNLIKLEINAINLKLRQYKVVVFQNQFFLYLFEGRQLKIYKFETITSETRLVLLFNIITQKDINGAFIVNMDHQFISILYEYMVESRSNNKAYLVKYKIDNEELNIRSIQMINLIADTTIFQSKIVNEALLINNYASPLSPSTNILIFNLDSNILYPLQSLELQGYSTFDMDNNQVWIRTANQHIQLLKIQNKYSIYFNQTNVKGHLRLVPQMKSDNEEYSLEIEIKLYSQFHYIYIIITYAIVLLLTMQLKQKKVYDIIYIYQ